MKSKVGREGTRTAPQHTPHKSVLGRLSIQEGLIVLAAALCDLNSWGHQFVMDDLSRIVGNALVRDPHRLADIFFSPYNVLYGMPSALFRPFTTLSFAVNYWITGLDPDGFHAANRLMHIASCLGIFWVLRRLFGNSSPAFFTALLFAVHPVQTEAITYISGRSDALGLMLFIFAWLFFVQTRANKRISPYVLSVVFYFLALLTKENGITFLGVALLTEWEYFSHRQSKELLLNLQQNAFRNYAGYIVATLGYLILRFTVLKGSVTVAVTLLDNPLAHTTAFTRILTALKILFQSLGQLLWPVHLSADYSYNQIPLVSRLRSLDAVFVMILSGTFVVVMVWTYRHFRDGFFGLTFFLMTYLIISNLIMPIGTIRADRLLYLPSLGILFMGGVAMAHLEHMLRPRLLLHHLRIAIAVILLLLGIRTVSRNRIWENEFTLYSQTVHDAPHSAKAHNNLGAQYFARGELKLSLEQYNIAETIKPDYPDLLNNIGSLFSREGKAGEAIAYLNRAVSLSPEKPEIRNNLGLALKAQGRLTEAIAQYDIVIQQYPSNADAHFNKANTLVAQNRIEEAITEYNQTLEIDPGYTLARTNLNLLLQKANPAGPKLP